MYVDIIRRIKDAVTRKRGEKCRTNNWFLLYDNAPAYRSVLVTAVYGNNNSIFLKSSKL